MQDSYATKIWLLLIALTLVSYSVALAGYEGRVFVAMVLAFSWFKGQMIIDNFMKLKKVRLLWRLIISFWLLLVITVIASLYFKFG